MMRNCIEIATDHPAFAGHFPGFPVLPGAVLLDEALRIIERERGIDLRQWQIAAAKFLDIVRPGDALMLEHDASAASLIRFSISVAERKVASGTLSSTSPGKGVLQATRTPHDAGTSNGAGTSKGTGT
jgi:3-hydroxyacyl-[acyl-carrier-protein] dehydratase